MSKLIGHVYVQQRRWNWLGNVLRTEGENVVFQHWGGHHKSKGREEDERQLGARRTVEKEKQGVVEDLEYSQGGGTEQAVLVRECDRLIHLRSETR